MPQLAKAQQVGGDADVAIYIRKDISQVIGVMMQSSLYPKTELDHFCWAAHDRYCSNNELVHSWATWPIGTND